jgi:2-C-methyl-D-erythritol 4-phosphate cytidylyltransferase
MKKYTVFVAGGSGSRMNSTTPKQFMLLAGTPGLMHTLQRFFDYDTSIIFILVLPESQIVEWKKLCELHQFQLPHQIVVGGETRFHSVQKGLSLVDGDGLVAVHDGVRPLVNTSTISAVFSTAELKGNAVPSVPLNDSLRRVSGDKNEAVLRSDYCLIQTPQCFSISLLKKAFEQSYSDSFTDCASVLEASGGKINLVDGNVENIKITTPADFMVAESFLKII